VTRDRIYGRARVIDREIILIDTGGLDEAAGEVEIGAQHQTRLAIDEADVVVFMTDARAGLIPADHEIAAWLRTLDKPLIHAVNKSDGLDPDLALAESSELGLDPFCLIAASHRRGLDRLSADIDRLAPQSTASPEREEGIHLALIGRPNAGKSTLLNRLLGEERALASPIPGTTRDPVHARVERDGQVYHLVDTAGIRRRRGSHEGIERFSTIKAMQAMEQAQVVVLLIDSGEGVAEQDARLAGHVIDAGRALVVVLNKWDCLDEAARNKILRDMGERMDFCNFCPGGDRLGPARQRVGRAD
jgi:GTPase